LSPDTEPQRASVPRREIVAWAMFDFANSSYTTIVVSVAFSVFFTRIVAAGPAADLWWGRGVWAANLIVLLLSPIAPHICHALWQALEPGGDVMHETWPEADQAALVQDEVELVLQVNGKLRGHMRAPKAAGREQLEQLALAHDAVTRYTDGQAVKKVIVVPGRLVNVVV